MCKSLSLKQELALNLGRSEEDWGESYVIGAQTVLVSLFIGDYEIWIRLM